MKRIPPSAVAATPCLFSICCSAIGLSAFLTTVYASNAADAQTTVEELNPAEKWVVAQVTAGDEADLRKLFPQEKDRKLSAKFVQDLLTANLTGVELHRNGVRITGAIINESIDMSKAQIPWEVWLNGCQFRGDANFERANFAGAISFVGSRFKGNANFNGMKVEQIANFNNAVFKKKVDFDSADIAGHFYAIEAKFKDEVKGTSFNSMKVRGTAFFRKAKFRGWVNFLLADFTQNFEAQGARFTKKGQVDFYGMKVGQIANFNDAVFKKWVDFSLADVGNFEAKNAQFKDAVLVRMNCRGKGDFTGAKFSGSAYVNNAHFDALDLSSSHWPTDRNDGAAFELEGMSYKYICRVPEKERESHHALLKLAEQSAYSADIYSRLEEFFLRQGYRGDADKAFIAEKCRERKGYRHNGDWFRWIGSWMLYLLVGYGRCPWQAGWFCLAIIGLGWVVFPLKKMELQDPEDRTKPEEERPHYNRFWYSLGLFLPVVDLKTSEVWGPKKEYRFLRNYLRVHILLGWILVPIFLAAITGLIK
jgi:uncharacterized protein YjbI with pentapeptide repeats